MKTLLYIATLLFFMGANAQGTLSINGQVTDAKGETQPGVTVFISNSTYITSTSNDGKFSLNNLRPGTYEIVCKFIGFVPSIQNVTLVDKSITISAKLEQSNTTLNTVTINGLIDANRKRYMALFIKNFIGETPNASQCKILNPEVINFTFDNDVLQANNDDFIVVENKALGYTIRYLIKQFDLNVTRNSCISSGSPHFEEFKDPGKQTKWDGNRAKAYLGSRSHFYKALKNNAAATEGFGVYVPDTIANLFISPVRPVKITSIFEQVEARNRSGRLNVFFVYFHEREVAVLRENRSQSFITSGEWSKNKLADLTPIDYITDIPAWSKPSFIPRRLWVYDPRTQRRLTPAE